MPRELVGVVRAVQAPAEERLDLLDGAADGSECGGLFFGCRQCLLAAVDSLLLLVLPYVFALVEVQLLVVTASI